MQKCNRWILLLLVLLFYYIIKMTLVLNSGNINIENIHFLEPKKNIIIDGNFTKILYADDDVSINGIYILCPLVFNKDDKSTKSTLSFQPNHPVNIEFIKKMRELENQILQYYNTLSINEKKINATLYNQLTGGKIKIYSNYLDIDFSHSVIILKISGVWETNYEVGITYKLLHSNNATF